MINKFKKIGSLLSLSLAALSFSFSANANEGDCAATYIYEDYQWGYVNFEIPALQNGEIINVYGMAYQSPSYQPTPMWWSTSFKCTDGVTYFW